MAETQYKPFPTFTEWIRTDYDSGRWQRYSQRLEILKDTNPEQHKRAIEIIGKIAAAHTGAIEGLYNLDRGITITIATGAALIEEAFSASDKKTTDLVSTQLEAYEYILDWATKKEPVNESWLRELHAQICAKQGTYKVLTPQGTYENKELPLGSYKEYPNDVKTQSGNIHRYASPELTSSEMGRFVRELQSEEFDNAHTLLQVSYSHYALAAVHPFADGNGRMARVLGSVYAYRSLSIPFLVLDDDKKEYFAALEDSDNGNYQPFVGFVSDCCFNAINIVVSSLKAANMPNVEESVSAIKKLYFTKSGYTHDEIDDAAKQLMQILHESMKTSMEHAIGGDDKISFKIGLSTAQKALSNQYRAPVGSGGNCLTMDIRVYSSEPASANEQITYFLAIPKDSGKKDDFVLFDKDISDEPFVARVDELLPDIKNSLKLRIELFVEDRCRTLLAVLRVNAEDSL